jgi:hypothetical protein
MLWKQLRQINHLAELLPFLAASSFFANQRADTTVARSPMDPLLPVAAARCWLLTTAWRRHGLLSVDAVPGARRRK